ncbi:hypothetical protein G5B46_07480 [Caulobacter sp. 602-2]|uniref:Uncharacterized protein n=1 Tax=Caulobacter sp. 602-2 TaxID=2710887 RepID=A0A6G4QV85_9CAUL|nr:hypothetical protein [Caulobacter sp. 602-2]NGM49442.1 hypothetical protein [Caulobacter sp. 602-2]
MIGRAAGLVLALASGGTAMAEPQPRACYADWTVEGWNAKAYAHAWADGRLEQVEVVVAPPEAAPRGEPATPWVRYLATATAPDGTPRAWAIEARMVAFSRETRRGWTVDLLADGVLVGGGPVTWTAAPPLRGMENLPVLPQSDGVYRMDATGVLDAIDQAGRLEVAVRAKGRAPVILAFEGPGRAKAQAVGEAAMDRLRRTVAGEALDGANCRALAEGR